LRRERFGWPEAEIDRAIRQISRFAERVVPAERIAVIIEDPTDN
jgi:hypothetical protein